MLPFISKMKNTTKTIGISILLTLLLTAAGGYYEWINAIGGIFLSVWFLYLSRKNKAEISMETYLIVPFLLLFFYALSSLYAVDSGMAWTGVVKKIVPFLFALCLLFSPRESRKKLLFLLPEIACFLTAFSLLLSLIPALHPYIFMAGRYAGTFGYANTYALFLFLALLLLISREKSTCVSELVKKISMGLFLIAGLFLTGSRYTWLLCFVILIVYALHEKASRKWMTGILSILAVSTVLAGTIFRHTEAMGRFFTTNLSSLYGRFLYWQDALTLIRKHPFGMGYLGYFYKQTEIQTGVYTVRYVHNDLLQWVLDIGLIPVLILLFFLVRALLNQKRKFFEKLLLVTILIHSLLEFDFEHTAIMCLFVLILSCSNDEFSPRNTLSLRSPGLLSVPVFLGLFCLYFSIPLSLYAAENTKSAAAIYPYYTDALTTNLSLEEDADTAKELAHRILKQNDTVSLAYDALAEVAFLKNDFSAMTRNKESAIRYNKFDKNEYISYLSMLNEMLTTDEFHTAALAKMKNVLSLIETNKNSVSPLGKKIDDKVDIDLPAEVVKEISEG